MVKCFVENKASIHQGDYQNIEDIDKDEKTEQNKQDKMLVQRSKMKGGTPFQNRLPDN